MFSHYFRLPRVVTFDTTGYAELEVDLEDRPFVDTPGEVSPGTTWYFQGWYRDPGAGGSGVNLTDALAITWAP